MNLKTKLIFLISILMIISCSKKDDLTREHIVNSMVQQEIKIKNGDKLILNLGNFGDEEGAWIFEAPQNAKVSRILRELSSSSIFYEYSPLGNFTGKDTVGLILNRGSDGASLGINDTTWIYIITE